MRDLIPEEQLGYLLVRSADQVSRPWLLALRTHGINPRQFSVLAILAREPALSQAELARRLMVTPQSMGESLTTLLDAGLLRRWQTAPGRSANLDVTAKGRALLRRAYPVVEASERTAFAALNSKERKKLGGLLRKLLA